jgi:type IV pilus assembly protein PilW
MRQLLITPQRGAGLTELMIGMALGLFILAGLLGVFSATRLTDRTQDGLSRLQESGRFTIEMMERELRKAGYRTNIFGTATEAFPLANPFTADGQVITGTDNSVSIRYQGSADGTTRDCLGATVSAGTIVTEILSINANSELQCQAQGQTQSLVEGVEAMQIGYGEDTNGDTYADRYIAAATPPNWVNIVSLRVEAVVRSNEQVNTAPQPYTFNSAIVTPADRRLRRVYSTVISIRNRQP